MKAFVRVMYRFTLKGKQVESVYEWKVVDKDGKALIIAETDTWYQAKHQAKEYIRSVEFMKWTEV